MWCTRILNDDAELVVQEPTLLSEGGSSAGAAAMQEMADIQQDVKKMKESTFQMMEKTKQFMDNVGRMKEEMEAMLAAEKQNPQGQSEGYDPDTHKLTESIWETTLLVFLPKSPVSIPNSLLSVFLILLNVVVQVSFTGVVLLRALELREELGDGFEIRALEWRLGPGHHAINYDPSTNTSLVTRVCGGYGAEISSTAQLNAYEGIMDYLTSGDEWGVQGGLGGPLCFLAVLIWAVHVGKEIMTTWSFASAVWAVRTSGLSNEGLAEQGDYGGLGLSPTRIAVVLLTCLLRFLVAVILWISGVFWVTHTVDVNEIILNCAALSFVLDFDELLFGIVPNDLLKQFQRLGPMPRARLFSRPCPIDLHSVAVLKGVVLGLVVWFFIWRDFTTHIDNARRIFCSGDQNFVFVEDTATGVVHAAPSLPADLLELLSRSPSRQAVLGAVLQRADLSPHISARFVSTLPILSAFVPLWEAAVDPTEIKELQSLTSAESTDKILCQNVDNDTAPAVSMAMQLTLGISSCDKVSQVAGGCSNATARTFCPEACGCHLADSGMYTRGGCTQQCNDRVLQHLTILEETARARGSDCSDQDDGGTESTNASWYGNFFTNFQESLVVNGHLVLDRRRSTSATFSETLQRSIKERTGGRWELNSSVDVDLVAWFQKSLVEGWRCTFVLHFEMLFYAALCMQDLPSGKGSLASFCPRTCGVCSSSSSPTPTELDEGGWHELAQAFREIGVEVLTSEIFSDAARAAELPACDSRSRNASATAEVAAARAAFRFQAHITGIHTFRVRSTIVGSQSTLSVWDGVTYGQKYFVNSQTNSSNLCIRVSMNAGSRLIITVDAAGDAKAGDVEVAVLCEQDSDEACPLDPKLPNNIPSTYAFSLEEAACESVGLFTVRGEHRCKEAAEHLQIKVSMGTNYSAWAPVGCSYDKHRQILVAEGTGVGGGECGGGTFDCLCSTMQLESDTWTSRKCVGVLDPWCSTHPWDDICDEICFNVCPGCHPAAITVVGPCQVDFKNWNHGVCLTSPGFPQRYEQFQMCEVKLEDHRAIQYGPLHVIHWELDPSGTDVLILNGEQFGGFVKPSGIVPAQRTIIWSSDFSLGENSSKGWQLCFEVSERPCESSERGATDALGRNCKDLAASAPFCDPSHDSEIFRLKDMCCHCGGGTFEVACPTTAQLLVTVGPSTSVKQCVAASSALACSSIAANPGRRRNMDDEGGPEQTATFVVSRSIEGEMCATRTDESAGWSMNLQISCTPSLAAEPAHTVLIPIGRSPSYNRKCIRCTAVAGLLCDATAADPALRLNQDIAAEALYTFNISVEGDTVCAERTDAEAEAGWEMNLEIACQRTLTAGEEEEEAGAVLDDASTSQVAIVSTHAAAIHWPSGLLRMWGSSAVYPSWEEPVAAVASGYYHWCAILKTNHTLQCWFCCPRDYYYYYDYYGDDYYDFFDPDYGQAEVPVDLGAVVGVVAGRFHTCAIAEADHIGWCWGKGMESVLPQLTAWGPMLAVAAYSDQELPSFVCGILETSRILACWGGNYEQLPPDSLLGTEVSSLALGLYHGCAIRALDRSLSCWLFGNNWGQADVPTDLGAVAAVATAWVHTCAIREGSRTMACWGSDFYGQMSVWPAMQVRAVVVAPMVTCVIDTLRELICWGDHGQVPVPPQFVTLLAPPEPATCLRRLSRRGWLTRVEVAPGSRYYEEQRGRGCGTLATDLCRGEGYGVVFFSPDGSPFSDAYEFEDLRLCTAAVSSSSTVAAAGSQTCAVRESSRSLECWGLSAAAAVPAHLGPVAALAAHIQFFGTTCAIVGDERSLSCWTLGASEPGLKEELGPVAAVAAGGVDSEKGLICAIQERGRLLHCWGGDNETNVPSDLGPVAAVAASPHHVCAIQEGSHTLRCWGRDNHGQASVPGGLGPVQAVAVGWEHTCAVAESSSRLSCWGSDELGQATVPVGLGLAVGVGAGSWHTCAIRRADRHLLCWGSNSFERTEVPDSLGPVASVALGSYHTCAVEEVGHALVCWGRNEYGQVQVPEGLGPVALGDIVPTTLVTAAFVCHDAPADWRDSVGEGCRAYSSEDWCSPSGSYGLQWSARWGTFGDWAATGQPTAEQACCLCGGGQWANDSFWHVLTGPCELEGDCVMSPRFPYNYGNGEACKIQVLTPNWQNHSIEVVSFSTEGGFDMLQVDGVSYSGSGAPALMGVKPEGTLLWSADDRSTRSGWKLCAVLGVGPAAGEEGVHRSFWGPLIGPCQQQGDCITSPNYKNSNYENDQFCNISINPSAWQGYIIELLSLETQVDHDILFVNGAPYSGPALAPLPDSLADPVTSIYLDVTLDVTPSESIIWTSDGSVTKPGWIICPLEEQPKEEAGRHGRRMLAEDWMEKEEDDDDDDDDDEKEAKTSDEVAGQ